MANPEGGALPRAPEHVCSARHCECVCHYNDAATDELRGEHTLLRFLLAAFIDRTADELQDAAAKAAMKAARESGVNREEWFAAAARLEEQDPAIVSACPAESQDRPPKASP